MAWLSNVKQVSHAGHHVLLSTKSVKSIEPLQRKIILFVGAQYRYTGSTGYRGTSVNNYTNADSSKSELSDDFPRVYSVKVNQAVVTDDHGNPVSSKDKGSRLLVYEIYKDEARISGFAPHQWIKVKDIEKVSK